MQRLKLPRPAPATVLATGAFLKNRACLLQGDEALWSAPHGDLSTPEARAALEDSVAELLAAAKRPVAAFAHDLHPDFASTHVALEWAERLHLPARAVQHHHAHLGVVMAEQGWSDETVFGWALDGVGLGSDGRAWGGELLSAQGAGFERVAHLSPLALPGGDAAAREPWRVAAAALHALGQGDQIAQRFGQHAAAPAVAQMLERGLRCPPTSSLGRWFDAAAALLGVRELAAFEGQAPMLLEALADAVPPRADLAALVPLGDDGALDLLPLFDALRRMPAPEGATLFHHAVAEGLARWVLQAAAREGIAAVALGGGCYLNVLLSRLLQDRLESAGLRVLQARQAPPNDGGIALGQAWVALCSLET